MMKALILLLTISFVPNPPECTSCHSEVVKQWRASSHYSAPDGLRNFERAPSTCQKCHVPLAGVFGKERAWKSDTSARGVGCLLCHFVRGVKGEADFVLEFDRCVMGGVSYGQDHCSEEWKVSVDDVCNSCHFFKKESLTVMDRYAGADSCSKCHRVHSLEVSEKRAFSLQVSCSMVSQEEGRVKLTVKNLTGHHIPAGLPTKALKLTLFVGQGTAVWSQVLEKVMVDRDYRVLTSAGDMFSLAREVIKDSRLKPFEERVEVLKVKFGSGYDKFVRLNVEKIKTNGEVIYSYSITSPCAGAP